MKALVLGNGKTRIGLDLAGYKALGVYIAGCNALYRDFIPDMLCVVDGKMLSEVWQAKAHEGVKLLYVDKNIKPWRVMFMDNGPAKPLGWHNEVKAGPTLAEWLPKLQPGLTHVFLAGMDIGAPSDVRTNNNVYEDTKNYRPSWNPVCLYNDTDESAWKTVFDKHPEITWGWVCPAWRKPPSCWPKTVVVYHSQRELDSAIRGV
jgi:hypothetical protein